MYWAIQYLRFHELTSRLNEVVAFTDNFILALDDYVGIRAFSVVNVRAFLIKHLSRQTHLVITPREDLQLPIALLRAP